MQKGFVPVLVLAVGIILTTMIGVFFLGRNFIAKEVIIINKIDKILPTVTQIPKSTESSEEYCHNFKYTNCPSSCQVSPSCPVCTDIGCHAKWLKK